MKILHCCLAAFYIDNYGYQENMLPKMHKLQGHEVAILASTETYMDHKELGYTRPGSYINEYGIPVTRIPYVNNLPHRISSKLRIYSGIKRVLEDFGPDILFIHDSQFVGIKEIVKYVRKRKNVKVFVDSHTDFINSGRNWISRNILHRLIYRWCAKKIEPYTTKFYGTLPLRVDFYRDVYGIDEEKLDLLVLGADLTEVNLNNRESIRNSLRKNLGIKDSDFVLITGGKIDKRKLIHNLLRVMNRITDNDIRLLCFGQPNEEMKETFNELVADSKISHLGWLKPREMYEYMMVADLAVFPGTHSVLWEQAIGLGLPAIFRRWKGMGHVDLGGNCLFLEGESEEELEKKIYQVKLNQQLFQHMRNIAREKGMKRFSYYEIAKRAIEI